uniref:Uncharacterized protein n=1 Tax=Engystomops pustulosus TaxID=76066 RepID=A0AAV6YT56_ENGPU|nr:hypothetical protein GDO81_019885 [Engystomops pustulosus]
MMKIDVGFVVPHEAALDLRVLNNKMQCKAHKNIYIYKYTTLYMRKYYTLGTFIIWQAQCNSHRSFAACRFIKVALPLCLQYSYTFYF